MNAELGAAVELVQRQIRKKGYCRLAGPFSRQDFMEISLKLGKVFSQTEIRSNRRNGRWIGCTDAIPVHTDHIHSNVVGWFCVRRGAKDEPTVLVDMRHALHQLRPNERRSLENVWLPVSSSGGQDFPDAPILSMMSDGPCLNYQPWAVAAIDHARRHPMVRRLCALIEAVRLVESRRVRLDQGGILFANGHSTLHGRDRLEDNSRRFLLRNWIHTEVQVA